MSGFRRSQVKLLVNTPAYFQGAEDVNVVHLTKDAEKDVDIEWLSASPGLNSCDLRREFQPVP